MSTHQSSTVTQANLSTDTPTADTTHKARPPLPTQLIHGADYNPDQWLHAPDVLEMDPRLMAQAHCNSMTIGVFSWAHYEPAEGQFQFDWLIDCLDRLHAENITVLMATPSGGKPAWLAQAYPEVRRVNALGQREEQGGRHNHCYTSPVFRDKVHQINSALAEIVKNHPAIMGWHISNEFEGECYCPLCQAAFREWLKERYNNNLDALNQSWWSSFWSHTYTEWSQIQAPGPLSEFSIHGLSLDWHRFVTDQTVDYMNSEIKTLRAITPDLPITTNFNFPVTDGDFAPPDNARSVGKFYKLNYWRFAEHLDFIAWDCYPEWHKPKPNNYSNNAKTNNTDEALPYDDEKQASDVAFFHNLCRSLKQQPFYLMECAPGQTNWQPVGKQKRPGMHQLMALQAVSLGANSVQYFQWRACRGGFEKFHSSIMGQSGNTNTRIFSEVAQVSQDLEKLSYLANEPYNSGIQAEVGLIFDWENLWAIDLACGPRNDNRRRYVETCKSHYLPFWRAGIATDIIEMASDFTPYKILIAPMLYMLKADVTQRLEQFVEQGGQLVLTYWSGIVDEADLCFQSDAPGPLQKLTGLRVTEVDQLYPEEKNHIRHTDEFLNEDAIYDCIEYCEVLELTSASALAHYTQDYYADLPAITVNKYGQGKVYYLAARMTQAGISDFTNALIKTTQIDTTLADAPEGVCIQQRQDSIFLMNFGSTPQQVAVSPKDIKNYENILWTKPIAGAHPKHLSYSESVTSITLPAFGVCVFRNKKSETA